jgi:hypothetical protein
VKIKGPVGRRTPLRVVDQKTKRGSVCGDFGG